MGVFVQVAWEVRIVLKEVQVALGLGAPMTLSLNDKNDDKISQTAVKRRYMII